MKTLLIFAAAALLAAGCASPNVNPPHARANTGYVDFHTDSAGELSWEVARFQDRSETFKRVFSEVKPLPGRVLRLAFPPGHHRFRVTFLNRAIREPALVEVGVQDGMITPVHVVLIAEGAAQVDYTEQHFGATIRGRYGHTTQHSSVEASLYRVSAGATAPVAYAEIEHMPYARGTE